MRTRGDFAELSVSESVRNLKIGIGFTIEAQMVSLDPKQTNREPGGSGSVCTGESVGGAKVKCVVS